MKKEIRKMYLWAIAKIVFAVGLGVLLVIVMRNSGDIEPVGVVVCSVLWGIVVLIYLISGILTIKNGASQGKEYMANSHYSEMQLDEEYKNSKAFSRLHVGNVHIFANASDGFYIIPLADITEIRVSHEGHNRAKGRSGYYYLRISAKGLKHQIKMYYVSKRNVYEAVEYLNSLVSL